MIGIPSKGRAGRSQTLAAVPHDEVWIVCPDDEKWDYRAAYPWVQHVIGQTGTGIGAARQTLLDFARSSGTGPFWMLDDDITGFFWKVKGKLVKCEMGQALSLMEDILTDLPSKPVALAGPQFRHRAWSGPDHEWDKHLRNVIRVEPEAPIDYWPHLKEDLDVVLQALMAGWHTVRFNIVAFDSPHMGSTEGGCRDDYDAGLLDEACRALVKKWPGVVSLHITEEAQLTNRVDWREVRRRQEALA